MWNKQIPAYLKIILSILLFLFIGGILFLSVAVLGNKNITVLTFFGIGIPFAVILFLNFDIDHIKTLPKWKKILWGATVSIIVIVIILSLFILWALSIKMLSGYGRFLA